MPTRLKPIALTVYKDRSGSDVAQVPASGITAKVYRRGASVSAAGPTTVASHTVIAVYDAGRLKVGDTVQKGTSAAATGTVYEVTSPTSVKIDAATGTLTLSRGDRLLVTNSRPTLYDESTGGHSTGSSDVATTARGFAQVYSTEPSVDVILTGTGITDTLLTDVAAGFEEVSPFLDIRDFGGAAETDSLIRAVAALPTGSGGTIFLPPGTYSLSTTLAITTPNVRILGSGRYNTTIQPSAANPAYDLIHLDASFCSIEECNVDGRGSQIAAYDIVSIRGVGLSGNQVFNCEVKGCFVQNAQRNCLRIVDAYNSYFESSYFDTAYNACVVIDASSANTTHVEFHHCSFQGAGQDATTYDFPAVNILHGFAIKFLYSRFESNRGGAGTNSANGIYALNTIGLSVLNCHFETSPTGAAAAAVPGARPYTFIGIDTSRYPVVKNCTFNGSSDATLRVHRAVNCYNATYGEFGPNDLNSLQTWGYQLGSDCPGATVFHTPLLGAPATTHSLGNAVAIVHGDVLSVPNYATGSLPAYDAGKVPVGSLAYDTTTNNLKVMDTSHVWVKVGTQT